MNYVRLRFILVKFLLPPQYIVLFLLTDTFSTGYINFHLGNNDPERSDKKIKNSSSRMQSVF